jgi:nickel/cobalt exporter
VRLRRWGISLGAAISAVVILVIVANPAGAHPLGTFTINVYTGLVISPDQVSVDYVVDLAEIATVQAVPFADDDGDGTVTDPEWADYGQAGCASWTRQLSLHEERHLLPLRVERVTATSQPGEAGLATLRIECRMAADRSPVGRPPAAGDRTITFADDTFASRRGWREVTATGTDTVIVRSDVPRESSTARLTAYPPERLNDPIDQRSARVVVRPGPAAADRAASPADTVASLGGGWTAALNDIVDDRLRGQGFAVAAVLAAVALGVLHALAPGHGKTVVAAYLIGQRGSVRHAGALALSVALTHTAGVLVLGALLWVAFVTAPERLYPVLGVASGAIIAGLGVGMLSRARRGGGVAGHHHHTASDATPAAADATRPRAGTVVALGFAGGLVPTPSALLVMVGSLSVGRVWFGLLLVTAYGTGMAAALVGLGLVLAQARNRFERHISRVGTGRLHALSHALPGVTAVLVVLAGLALMVRSAVEGSL